MIMPGKGAVTESPNRTRLFLFFLIRQIVSGFSRAKDAWPQTKLVTLHAKHYTEPFPAR